MGQLSLWEREYRMLGQDVFHAKKLIRDSGGKNDVAERRIATLREKQVELLLTKVKELEEQKMKGEQEMNIQKIQLEIGLSADLKGFLRELFGKGQKGTEEVKTEDAKTMEEMTSKNRRRSDEKLCSDVFGGNGNREIHRVVCSKKRKSGRTICRYRSTRKEDRAVSS